MRACLQGPLVGTFVFLVAFVAGLPATDEIKRGGIGAALLGLAWLTVNPVVWFFALPTYAITVLLCFASTRDMWTWATPRDLAIVAKVVLAVLFVSTLLVSFLGVVCALVSIPLTIQTLRLRRLRAAAS